MFDKSVSRIERNIKREEADEDAKDGAKNSKSGHIKAYNRD